MSRRLFLTTFLIAVLIGTLGLLSRIQRVEASGTIYIRADGSIDPPTAPISTIDNTTYTFADDINDSIVVERDNIVVDGAGYTLQGTGSGWGIDLSGRTNVTVRNTKIENFWDGIYLVGSFNNSVSGNTFTNDGLAVWYSHQNVVENNTVNDKPLVARANKHSPI